MKPSNYWPVFLIVAALSTAAVWRFAPKAPLSPTARARCVEWTHKVRQVIGLEAAPCDTLREERASEETARLLPPEEKNASVETEKKSAAQRQEPQKPAMGGTESVQAVKQDDDPLSMTPAQRKLKYEELTKKAEARRREILRANVMKSEEGRNALEAVKKFKEFSAEVEKLKEKYGETDSRVVSKRGDLLKLKDEVRRTNEIYKKWKEAHQDGFTVPEADETYRRIIAERRLYKN